MEIFTYRTRDGKAFFKYAYVKRSDNRYDVSIHLHPSYNGRSSNQSVAHWLSFSNSPIGRKICFTSGKEPEDLQTAKNFSMLWSEVTWCYIQTGETIDRQVSRQAPSTKLNVNN